MTHKPKTPEQMRELVSRWETKAKDCAARGLRIASAFALGEANAYAHCIRDLRYALGMEQAPEPEPMRDSDEPESKP